MSTSDRAFNQVKAILSKLDRSIDEAREKRTQRATRESAAPAGAPAGPFGRAQPLPKSGSSLDRWK